MAGIKTIVEAAELIAEVRSAFAKIESLQEAQKQMMGVIEQQDKRIRELEASVREVRSDVKFEALKETQNIVNAVQGQIYNELKSLSLAVDRMDRQPAGKVDLELNKQEVPEQISQARAKK